MNITNFNGRIQLFATTHNFPLMPMLHWQGHSGRAKSWVVPQNLLLLPGMGTAHAHIHVIDEFELLVDGVRVFGRGVHRCAVDGAPVRVPGDVVVEVEEKVVEFVLDFVEVFGEVVEVGGFFVGEGVDGEWEG